MRNNVTLFLAAALLGTSLAAHAVEAPQGSARQNYISVMSKAGTPTPRPKVPLRNVTPPNGARLGYDYYYGLGYGGGYGYVYGSPSYSSYQQRSSGPEDELPGYRTEPGESRADKSFVNY